MCVCVRLCVFAGKGEIIKSHDEKFGANFVTLSNNCVYCEKTVEYDSLTQRF